VTGDGVNRLGRKVRDLREAKGLSLRSLASKAGVSESFVSQVERGHANPSVASLRRIAEALDTSVGSLFEERSGRGRVIKAAHRARLVHPQRKWEDFLLTPRDSQRLEVILSLIEPGEGSGDESYSHDSDEECVIVLKGSLEFKVGAERYLLEEGDSLTFESRLPHWNRNPGPSKAEVLWVITPPTY
jgi:transcriptional regulator with XRE-family HTH domain